MPDPYRPEYLPEEEYLDAFPEETPEHNFGIMTEWDRAYQKQIETLAPYELLLTPEQEKELSAVIQAGHVAGEQRLNKHLSDEQRAELDQTFETGRAARDTLVVSNLRLAAWFVRQTMDVNKQQREDRGKRGERGAVYADLASLSDGDLDYADRMQLASIGLMRAAEKFDGSSRFSTYAMYSMEHEVGQAIFADQSPLKIPVDKRGEIRRFERTQTALEDSLQRQPTYLEISSGVTSGPIIGEKQAMQLDYLSHRRQQISYEELDRLYQAQESDAQAENTEHDTGSITDHLADGGVDMSVYEEAALNELGARVDAALAGLDERSQRVLELRFGLENGIPLTLDECGRELGLSGERIRQLEAKALTKMRHPKQRDGIKDLLEEFETPTFGAPTEVKVGEPIEAELHITNSRPYIFEVQAKTTAQRLQRRTAAGGYTLEQFRQMQEDSLQDGN